VKLRHLEIKRFRGIKELNWDVGGSFVCLLGKGDSTKTTILDAIEYALSPRWNIEFDDSDFFGAETAESIEIVATVGDLPAELEGDAKYGLALRGLTPDGLIRDEPDDGDALVLSVRLHVDASLEPKWTAFNERTDEPKQIAAKDREKLGCVRLGAYPDRHFTWGRGSVLTHLTGKADSLSEILAEAGRAARSAVNGVEAGQFERLNAGSWAATQGGQRVGVEPRTGFAPALDVKAVSIGQGALSLHDGPVPVRRAGLGTRRLLTFGMQREVAKTKGLTLIDEVELGLEPHRIRHLLRVLRDAPDEDSPANVILTTHAPVVLQELSASDLRIVRSHTDGVTRVLAVPADLQGIVKKTSEAFLSRKVVVCEGMTELTFVRGLDTWWTEETGRSFGLEGVALADGGGSRSAEVAVAFGRLEFPVALLADSDREPVPARDELQAAGVSLFLWDGACAFEERLAEDLPWEGVCEMVKLAMELSGSEESIRDSIGARLEPEAVLRGQPSSWVGDDHTESDLRAAIGKAAKAKEWFKPEGRGERLASIVRTHQASIAAKDLGQKIEALKAWIHGAD
jgi:putative ATP-dependent endonuclease of OLD family